MKESIHDGHRQRMISRFLLDEGFDGFAEHEILEVLLYYVIPRADTNRIAHGLLERFGSLAAVCEAPMVSLLDSPGIGERAAAYLKMIPATSRAYNVSKVKNVRVINSTEEAGEFMRPYFIGCNVEKFYLLSLDSAGKVLGVTLICEGDIDRALVNLRKIVETVIMYNATRVIVAHNHPRSVALPSNEDISCTRKIKNAMECINVRLLDHLIYSYGLEEDEPEGEYVSLAADNLIF